MAKKISTHDDHGVAGGRRFALLLMATACLGLLLSGCAQIRMATYPRDFVYLDSSLVRSEMALMSLYMQQIDDVLADDSRVSSEQQAQLISILSSIDAVTNRLAAGSIETNHLTIDDHIDAFKQDVTVAMQDARSDPPNYFALGRLSGSCAACHRFR